MDGGTFKVALLISAAAVGLSSPAWGQEQGDPAGQAEDGSAPIIVYGYRQDGAFDAAAVEDELDEDEIATYGLNNVGELLEEIGADVDDSDDGPVVLINGRPTNGAEDIATLPTEAVSRVQLLPREASAQFGGRPDRRVVNVVVKPHFRQRTGNAKASFATAGGGRNLAGQANYTTIANGNRTTIDFQVTDVAALLESQRDILTDVSDVLPYDLVGNIVPFPVYADEIDPALSLAAGETASVTAVPAGVSNPTLAQFAALANEINTTDLGDYRTLVPSSRAYELNLSAQRRLGQVTTLSISARGQITDEDSRIGAASALFSLPATSPFSPFSREVGIARYIGDPLVQDRAIRNFNTGATLNTLAGKWRLTLNGNYAHAESRTLTDRRYDLTEPQAGIDAGTLNPFADLTPAFGFDISRDRARTNSDKGTLQFIAAGSPFALPTGQISTTLRVGASTESFNSRSTVLGTERRAGFERDEINGQLAVDVPLVGGSGEGSSPLGQLTANLTAWARKVTAVNTLGGYSYGLRWMPTAELTIRGSVAYEETPPSAQILTDPIITIEGVRVFDFLRNETVTVSYITGGNPLIAPQDRKVTRLGADWNLLPRRGLVLTAEYSRTVGRNTIAGLPPVSAEIQTAFPDRYQRDGSGRLVQVDARAVSFARDKRDELRWGISFRHRFRTTRGAARAGSDDTDGDPFEAPSSGLQSGVGAWRLIGSLTHNWILHSTRLARTGLPVIDLLDGGAAGYGSGLARHSIDFDVALAGQGAGLRVKGEWTSSSTVRAAPVPSVSDLRFSPREKVDAQLFADLDRLFPGVDFAKLTRISLFAENIFDSRQRVSDGAGITPLGYQPYLIEPLGRTIGVSIRKVF